MLFSLERKQADEKRHKHEMLVGPVVSPHRQTGNSANVDAASGLRAGACCGSGCPLRCGGSIFCPPLAAAAAAAAEAAFAAAGGGRGELREVRRHSNLSAVPQAGSRAAALSSLPAAAAAGAFLDAPSGPASVATEPQEEEETPRVEGTVICKVRFEHGYNQAPTVRVRATHPAHGTHAAAVMVDEDAGFWLHGVSEKVKIPSVFSFGRGPEEGDYADIHPPRGTGRHKYTVLLFEGPLERGPLLTTLAGTPWHYHRRALGSLEALKADFQQQNEKEPTEIARCSVQVSYEDIQAEAQHD
ncbi:hypothetical protein Efla_002556 [Eimeria flavescens]